MPCEHRLGDAGDTSRVRRLVTVNSDDPAYFGGYLDDNLQACRTALGLTAAERESLARNSIQASFATAERKQQLSNLAL